MSDRDTRAKEYDAVVSGLRDEPCAFKRQCFRDGWDSAIAALPDMVEPIVWVRHPLGWNCDGFMIDARNLNSIYVMRGLYGKPRFDTVEDAKAACQAHRIAAILSAFGVQGGEA